MPGPSRRASVLQQQAQCIIRGKLQPRHGGVQSLYLLDSEGIDAVLVRLQSLLGQPLAGLLGQLRVAREHIVRRAGGFLLLCAAGGEGQITVRGGDLIGESILAGIDRAVGGGIRQDTAEGESPPFSACWRTR